MKPQEIAELRQLIEMLREYPIAEFDLDREGEKLRLKFARAEGSPAAWGDFARPVPPSVPMFVPQPVPSAPPAPPSAPSPASGAETGLHLIKAPIVGTFYSSPSPGAAPFVSVGDHVSKGQVVGVIEAMKLMNEIESDAAGEIVKCLVSNGQPIEFGQPLFSIRLD
ncbi:MAG: acetyl-CoA carboxylase biotin carboxyl carrier protein [Terracidiphilus sp.]